jgi:hypothetical protein
MSGEQVRIVLYLDPAADPIGGSLGGDGSPARPFSGTPSAGSGPGRRVNDGVGSDYEGMRR